MAKDSERRINKKKENELTCNKALPEDQKIKHPSKASSQIMHERFQIDFKDALTKNEFEEHSKINYMQANLIMGDLGFSNEIASTSVLVHDLWRLMKGDEHDSIKVPTLKVFLAGIMNFNMPWMKPKHIKNNPEYDNSPEHKDQKESIHDDLHAADHDLTHNISKLDSKNVGVWEDGECYLTDLNISTIGKLFANLHKNRQDWVMLRKKESKNAGKTQVLDFKPTLCKTSERLLEQRQSVNHNANKVEAYERLINHG